MGYGADEIYTRMAMRSLAQWRELFDRAGQMLFHQTGVIWMAREAEPYSVATCETLQRTGVRMEIVPGPELARRYPQMQLDVPGIFGIYEPDSGALMARRAVAAVVQEAVRHGVTYATGSCQRTGRRRVAGHRRDSIGWANSRRDLRVRLWAVAAEDLPRRPGETDLPDAPGGLLFRAAAG